MSAESAQAEDGALVERARRGDSAAYEALVRRYQEPALRLARRITGATEEAEEAAQDAFLKAYLHLDTFRDGAPFRPWLLRIVANESRNRRLAAGRREGLAARAAAGGDSGEPAPSPEAAALLQEEHHTLRRAVGALPAGDQRVIAYRYYLDLSESEMATALGVPRGTVKSRLSRALGRLRTLYAAVLAVLLLLLAGLGLALSPETRAAVAERLGLRRLVISHVPAVPTPPATPAAPATAPAGERVSLEVARARAGFVPLLPADPRLGPPDEVVLSGVPPGLQVTLVYRSRPDLPETSEPGVGLLLTQFRGDIPDDGSHYVKAVGPETRVETVRVGTSRGFWIAGAPHLLMYRVRDAAGQPHDATIRLAGNTVLWEQDDLTLRLESGLSRDAAVQLAASVR